MKIKSIKVVSRKERNSIIEQSPDADYLILSQTEYLPSSKEIDDYISIMEKYKMAVNFYPFASQSNRALGNPNPLVKLEIQKEEYINIIRNEVDVVIIINMKRIGDVKFNDMDNIFQFHHFIVDTCLIEGNYPYYGFYPQPVLDNTPDISFNPGIKSKTKLPKKSNNIDEVLEYINNIEKEN